MRKLILSAATIVSLAGCASVPPQAPVPVFTNPLVNEVISYAKTFCGIVLSPSDQGLIRLIASFAGSGGSVAVTVANAVCAGINTLGARRRLSRSGVVVVNHIPVKYTR